MSEESSYLLLPGEGDRGVCGFCLHCMASMVYSITDLWIHMAYCYESSYCFL
jgi:hypothetical protein